jgi:Fe-S-cluster containining protein
MVSPCSVCTVRGCCHSYTVLITGYDAWKIARGLDLPPTLFLDTLPQQVSDGYGFRLNPTERTYEIALKKQPGETPGSACQFWVEIGSLGRCGIYDFRPLVCQTYPTRWVNDHLEMLDQTLCQERVWTPEQIEASGFKTPLLHLPVEYDIYRLAVAHWNENIDHFLSRKRIKAQDFHQYLLIFYDFLKPEREKLSPESWEQMCGIWGSHYLQGRSPFIEIIPELEPWLVFIDKVREASST